MSNTPQKLPSPERGIARPLQHPGRRRLFLEPLAMHGRPKKDPSGREPTLDNPYKIPPALPEIRKSQMRLPLLFFKARSTTLGMPYIYY